LTEIFLKTGKRVSKREFLNYHGIETRLEKLSTHQNFAIPQGMLKKLKYLIQSIEDLDVVVSLAHGDFTPWNMFKTNNQKLFIYDWELASENYPYAFDAFHYIIQKGILIEHKSWKDIEDELYRTVKTFKLKEGFCFRKYLSLYLIVNTINYLEIFSQQYQWHIQVRWLLDTWNDAISFALKNHVIHRKLLVLDTFDFLFKKEYAGLKLPESSPEELGEYSDIDICMEKPLTSSLAKYLKNHSLVKKVIFRKTHTYSNILIQTEDNGILSIDAIHNFKRKSIQFLDTQEVLKTAYTDSTGIKKVSLMNSIRYIGFFYGLNGKTVPAKYTPYEEILEISPEEVDNLLYPFFLEGKTSRRALIQYLLKQPFNKGQNKWLNVIHYYLDLMKRVMFSKGMMITFSGVDGAGKSTVIELSRKELEKRLRKRVIVLRHRPSILPILSAWTKGKEKAEQDAIQTLPRQGKNKNIISSLCRFTYYYTDYFLGQIIVYLKYILRGDVVLYDRYYFDFINDSVRSNIQLPKWIMKWGYYFLLKPQINFFLYADAQIILNRKKELGQEDIKNLNDQYSSLFKQLDKKSPNHYLLIENIDLQKTLKTITKEITSRML
jgi:thymidylate kinase